MTGQALQLLLRLNLAASAAMLLVLFLRRPVRRAFGPLAAYLLWLAVPLCAGACLLPSAPLVEGLAPVMALTWGAASRSIPPIAQTSPDLAGLLLALWLAGAGATATLFSVRQGRFMRSLGRLEPIADDRHLLRGEHVGAGPVVLGSLRPRIVVPVDFEARFASDARALILAHERVHLARGDAALNGLVALLQCLAWFNPLVHLAAARLRADQEMACDAVVVSRHPTARRAYAEALLGSLMVPLTVPFGCHWPPSAARALKERLVLLNAASVGSLRRKAGIGLAALIGLGCAGAVWAAAPGPRLIGQPVWIQRPTLKELVRSYPPGASAKGVPGKALIDCIVGRGGSLENCVSRMETPAGAGFGKTALKLSHSFRMAAKSQDGRPTAGARVRIPFSFALAS